MVLVVQGESEKSIYKNVRKKLLDFGRDEWTTRTRRALSWPVMHSRP